MMSPVEERELSDPRKVVCVFGRSVDGLPHKVKCWPFFKSCLVGRITVSSV